jgi:hypothetical protein
LRLLWYRRDGTPYPEGRAGLFAAAKDINNDKLKRVALDKLDNGVEVSTVWLGLDHNFIPGRRPLIFETMLFVPQTKVYFLGGRIYHSDRESIGEQWRYATEEEALRGHKMLVKKWKSFKTANQVMNEKKSDKNKKSS